MRISNFDKRNKFSYTWENLLTMKMGIAVPYDTIDILPGDTWRYKAIPFLRMLAQIAPTMGEVCVRQHSFFVPLRIVWPKFYEGFMIPTENANGSLSYANFPTITNTWTKGSLGDYLHYPLGVSYESDALHIRAYQKVIKDWYMNLNIEDPSSVALSDGDGADSITSTALYNVNWPKDRFTGCFKEKQRGPEVELPVGDFAPVFTGVNSHSDPGTTPLYFQKSNGTDFGSLNAAYPVQLNSGASDLKHVATYASASSTTAITNPTGIVPSNLYADLRDAYGLHPSEFRLAWQINKKLEIDMRGGQKTPDWLLAHYGVKCSDARLQRSEFLGGSKSYFNVSEVLQTSSTDSTSPQGNMAGHGYCVYQSKPRTKTFEEHGIIVNIISICPRAVYSQGAPRESLKRTPEEFGLPVLSHTIMDAVYKGELMWTGNATDKDPFGYRNIYDEYRQKYSTLAGDFRDTLDYWTWARKFANQPSLNKQFIQVEQIDRPFATTGTDHFLVKINNIAKAYRPLPKRGDPGLIDHK